MSDGDPRPALIVGVVAVTTLAWGVATVINSTVTADAGSMDRGVGQVYGTALILGSGAALWWAIRRSRSLDTRSRRRWSAAIAATSAISLLVFGSVTLFSAIDHRHRTRALNATASWRLAFDADLANAYLGWSRDDNGTDTIYTGDKHEWWSLDPDGDGVRDSDAPILRTLREDGWADRGLAVFDSDGDHLIDQIEWAGSSLPGETDVWCIPVSTQRSSISAEWHEAVPRPCDGPPVEPAASAS